MSEEAWDALRGALAFGLAALAMGLVGILAVRNLAVLAMAAAVPVAALGGALASPLTRGARARSGEAWRRAPS